MIEEPVIVVSMLESSIPKAVALVSFTLSVANENCDAEIVLPTESN